MAIQTLYDVLALMDRYRRYLKSKGVQFNQDGFPFFSRDMFLEQWPSQVVPYDHRKNHRVNNPQKTVLCHYNGDKRIYPRLERVLDDIGEYRGFMGAVYSDVTITEDMDSEWQGLIMLLNQLYAMVIAVNDIKIVANIRTGDRNSVKWMSTIPKGVMCASGFLGCKNQTNPSDMEYISKLLFLRPSKLLIYGKHDKCLESHMDIMGVDYKVYPDFHRLCKGVC